MTSPTQITSPLRQRMMDDMRMRRLAPTTHANYLRVVRAFTVFLGRSPDTATVEDLRHYQLLLVDHSVSPVSLNAAITGLKFFFGTMLAQEASMAKMRPIYRKRSVKHVLPANLTYRFFSKRTLPSLQGSRAS
ncbi:MULTISPECIES: phage integrase N-terminal SAM-like domain-containing protein [unclassified Caballeronia]|uniref:phage integrase N-terminal SAM-like domain-containing protein n=1 Tax=unclassified Caballeronia TaxID=2646786 RepID=UPI0028149F20|nr:MULTISPECIES: phage integrase N-terminal SAM-like domain-containing protein [unclassified Caballeronia]